MDGAASGLVLEINMRRLAEPVLVASGPSRPFGCCGVAGLQTERRLMAPSYGFPRQFPRNQVGFSNFALWASAAQARALADVPILTNRKWVHETNGRRCGVAA